MLEVGLLGPVAARLDGVALPLRGARQRALLAALAIDAGRVVPVDVLVERVWGTGLPTTPENALQQQILKLRRVLGDDAVAFDPPGYRLTVAGDAVDSVRFEQLVKDGRAVLPEAPENADALLRKALAMWRGPALADFAYEEWAAVEAARLDDLRIQAEELRAEATLATGRQAEAIGDLERLVRLQPLREHPWALLMIALYRDGRQADALAAYSKARRTLVDELGVEPGAELRLVHERVLQHDPSVAANAGPAAPGSRSWPSDAALPPALRRHASAGAFVGRSAELERLSDSWSAAAAGQLGLVLVAGEPGAGKTRLLAEHARRVASWGGRVAYAPAVEEVSAPYGILISVLRQLVESADSQMLAEHVAAHDGELSRLVPAMTARVPALPAPRAADPETERFRLEEAVVAFLGAAASREPLLVVLDDLQWSDRATLGLLLRLLHGPDAPLLVVASYRETAVDQQPALRALLPDLLREPVCSRIPLGGLTERDVIALVDAADGGAHGTARTAVGQQVYRATDGNALFTTELLRYLANSGRLDVVPDSGDAAGLGVPETVRDLVLQRLERIGADAADVLLPATVIGASFETELLARVTGRSEEELVDALERAEQGALVVEAPEPGWFSFSHAMIQAALADGLGSARKRLLHRRVAEELSGAGASDARRLGELARHWLEAGRPDEAREAAVRAGDAALALLAPHDATRWYAQALELHAGSGAAARGELLVRLGIAERRAGSDAFRAHLLEAGRLGLGIGDGDLLARAALENNRGMHSRTGFVDVERIELLEAALELRTSADDPQRALLLATTSSELWSGDHDHRRALSDEALGVARRAGDERVLAEVIYRRAFALAEPATLRERLALTAELVELTDRLGDPLLRVLASVERSRAAIESADLGEALLHAHRQAQLAAECGDAYGRHGAGWAQGWPHALAGRYEEAERAANAAFAESTSSGQPDALAFYGAQIAVVRWDQGRLGELADGIALHAGSPEGLPIHRALAALALLEGGRPAEAGPLIDEAAAVDFEMPVDTIWLTGTCIWGEACILAARADLAEPLLERLLPWRDQVAFTGLAVHGAAARVAAELAALLDRDETEDLFAQAESIHLTLGAPAFVARTNAGWARWLRQNGHEQRARDRFEAARVAAATCDCTHLLARAEPVGVSAASRA